MARTEFGSALFQQGVALNQAFAAGMRASHLRRIEPFDPTEPAMHQVYDAEKEFVQAIADTTNAARATQLAERAAVLVSLWSGVYEQARDKGIALKEGK